MNALLRYSLLCLLIIITPLQAKSIVLIGDSLSAAYGMEQGDGWPQQLQRRLKKKAPNYQLHNLSTSGDTTANGLAKLTGALNELTPSIVIIQLGSNDALRGIPLSSLKRNLTAMILLSKKKGSKVLLISNRLPPNYGKRFTTRFKHYFSALGSQHNVPVVSEFLKGVADNPTLMQRDGLHPTSKAQQQLLNNVWPQLQPLL